MNNFSL